MPSELDEVAYLADHPAFRSRVKAAMIRAAKDVAAEEHDGSERVTLRKALATNVLQGKEDWTAAFAWAAATNVSITRTSIDSDLQWTVNGVWDSLSGAPPPPAP